MEKYSLKFLDQKTENDYQEQRNSYFRQPIFKYSHYGMMIISIIKLIIDIYDQDYSGLFAIIATQIYITLSLLIVKFRVIYIQLALILFNYSLILYEYKLSVTISKEALPLFTNSFSICHILIFLVLDVFQSYLLIITTMLFKLIYTIMIDSQMSINIYVATCALMGFLCFCSRTLNYQSRSNFLMSQKEDLWNKILPQIVDQPFVLFTFNNEKIEFQYQHSKQIDFSCQNTLDLKNFLRNSLYKNKTLEEFFFHICQKSIDQENQFENLEIQYLKVQYKITYSIFYYQQPLILIKFKNENSQIENNSRITQQKSKKQQFRLLQFFSKNLQLYIQNQDFYKVIFLRNICYKHMLNYKIQMRNHKLLSEKLEFLLHPLIELFEYKNIDLYYQKDEIKNLNTVKIYFRRLFYEIFLNCKKNSRIQIISFQNTPIIFYRGKQINCKPNDVLNLVINSLVKSQSRVSNNQIRLELHQDPLLSFK